MIAASTISFVAALGLGVYSYVGYPALLKLLGLGRARRRVAPPPFGEWPPISITIPVHNEAAVIAGTLVVRHDAAHLVSKGAQLLYYHADPFVTEGVKAMRELSAPK